MVSNVTLNFLKSLTDFSIATAAASRGIYNEIFSLDHVFHRRHFIDTKYKKIGVIWGTQ